METNVPAKLSCLLKSMFVFIVCCLALWGATDASAQTMTGTTTSTQELNVSAENLPPFYLGVSYDYSLIALGGLSPYRWSLLNGTLPAGLFLDRTGRLTGMPDSMGDYVFTLRVMDMAGATADRMYTVSVGLAGHGTATSTSTIPGGSPTPSTNPPTLILPPIILVPESQYVTSSPTTPLTSPNIIPNWNTPRILLLQNLEDLQIPIHALVRVAPDASGVNSHTFADIYYIGQDGKRHAFPTDTVYRTWYENSPSVISIPAWKLANIPLGKNVTYKPGKRILTFFSDNHWYVVAPNRVIRPLANEQAAATVYGSNWTTIYDRLSDAYFADYRLSNEGDVYRSTDFSPSSVQSSYTYPSQDMGL